MALKDLLAQSSELDEAAIEGVIRDYARFDPTTRRIVLLPEAQQLKVRERIMVYLTALQGWRFVIPEEPPSADASPGEIMSETSIVGGSLRPTLRQLTQEHWIACREGRYSMPSHNIHRLKDLLAVNSIQL